MMKAEKSHGDEEASTALILAVLLHGVAICTAIAGVVLVADRDSWTQPSLLIGNDPPGRVVALGVVYVLCQVAFAFFSAMDVYTYQLQSMAVTGIGVAFGGVSTILGGAYTVLAALALNVASFWLFVIAFLTTAIVYALQCAGIVTGLLRDMQLPR